MSEDIEEPAELIEEEPKLNKKNLLEDIGYYTADISTDDETEEIIEEDKDNAIIDIIETGLDIAEEFFLDSGCPPFKRKLWDERGKKALNKALNSYFPAGSAVGGVIDTPVIALGIGLGALFVCVYPVINYYIHKDKDEVKEIPETTTDDEEPTDLVEYEVPQTAITSTAPISNMNITPIERIQAREDNETKLPGF